ncbi:MAG: hypothetical protein LBR12_05165 [Opitutaceae bacterium]|jgi:hypothetical protein|nr:hypothetical protein [Opitutaceae bacterium]
MTHDRGQPAGRPPPAAAAPAAFWGALLGGAFLFPSCLNAHNYIVAANVTANLNTGHTYTLVNTGLPPSDYPISNNGDINLCNGTRINVATTSTTGGNGFYNAYDASLNIYDRGTYNSTNISGNGIYNYYTNSTINVTGTGRLYSTLTGGSGNAIYNGRRAFVFASGGGLLDLANRGGNALYNSANATLGIANGSLLKTTTDYGNGIYNIGNNTASAFVLVANATFNGTQTSAARGNIILNQFRGFVMVTTNASLNLVSNGGNALYNNNGSGGVMVDNSRMNVSTNSGIGIYNHGFFSAGGASALTVSAAGGVGIYNCNYGNVFLQDTASLTLRLNGASAVGFLNDGAATMVNVGINSRIILDSNGFDGAVGLQHRSGFFRVDGQVLNRGTVLLLNDLLSGTGGVVFDGGTLAGTGGVDATLGITLSPNGSTIISPGDYNNVTHRSAVGSLTVGGARDWSAGFVYDWQFDASSDTHDSLLFDGTLRLDGAYTLNLNALNASHYTGVPGNRAWTLLDTQGLTHGIGTWNLLNANSFLTSLGLQGTLRVVPDGNRVVLQFVPDSLGDYIWRATTNGVWSQRANWENNAVPNGPGVIVYFTRNQGASGGVVTVDSPSVTVGSLVIGSENASASGGRHLIQGNTIILKDNNSFSSITHLANASAGDTIASNLTFENEVIIATQSANPFEITGVINGAGHGLTKQGPGDLMLTNTNSLGGGNLSVNCGGLFLIGGGLSATLTTVSATAVFGGNGTLSGNLRMSDFSSALKIRGRKGGRWRESFKINGNLFADNGFTLDLSADFSNVHVSGPQLFSAAFTDWLHLDGNLSALAAAHFTVNLHNLGGSVNIFDWSLHSDPNSEVAFRLFTVTGTGDFDDTHWSLGNWTNPGWSLRWMDDAQGRHTLWLFYANPVRIPEPPTLALALGLLAAVCAAALHTGHRRKTTCRREMRRRNFGNLSVQSAAPSLCSAPHASRSHPSCASSPASSLRAPYTLATTSAPSNPPSNSSDAAPAPTSSPTTTP